MTDVRHEIGQTPTISAMITHAAAEATRRGIPSSGRGSTIVDRSTLGYRPGMRTEIRTAPRWVEPLEMFHEHLRARKLSPGTIYIRLYHLRVMSQAFRSQSPWTLTTPDIERYLASVDHMSRKTIRSVLASINALMKYGYRERYVNVNPCDLIEPIHESPGMPRPASDAAIREALDAADPRAKLAIQFGAFCGLRISEIARLRTTDLSFDGYGRPQIRVLGKGQKYRDVPVTPMIASLIQDAPAGYLFPSQKGTDDHLLPGSLGVLMRAALPAGTTPHMLRHRYASAVYRGNRDIRAVQVLLGHRSVNTTQVYTAIPDESLYTGVAAAGALSL